MSSTYDIGNFNDSCPCARRDGHFLRSKRIKDCEFNEFGTLGIPSDTIMEARSLMLDDLNDAYSRSSYACARIITGILIEPPFHSDVIVLRFLETCHLPYSMHSSLFRFRDVEILIAPVKIT